MGLYGLSTKPAGLSPAPAPRAPNTPAPLPRTFLCPGGPAPPQLKALPARPSPSPCPAEKAPCSVPCGGKTVGGGAEAGPASWPLCPSGSACVRSGGRGSGRRSVFPPRGARLPRRGRRDRVPEGRAGRSCHGVCEPSSWVRGSPLSLAPLVVPPTHPQGNLPLVLQLLLRRKYVGEGLPGGSGMSTAFQAQGVPPLTHPLGQRGHLWGSSCSLPLPSAPSCPCPLAPGGGGVLTAAVRVVPAVSGTRTTFLRSSAVLQD